MSRRRRNLAAGFLLADLALVFAIVALGSERPNEDVAGTTETTDVAVETTTTEPPPPPDTTGDATTTTTTSTPGQLVLPDAVRFCSPIDIGRINGPDGQAELDRVRDGFFPVIKQLDERGSDGFVALIFTRAPSSRQGAATDASEKVAGMLRTQYGSVFAGAATEDFWAGGEEGLVYVDAYISPGRSNAPIAPDPDCPADIDD